jgi:hypothetical protein
VPHRARAPLPRGCHVPRRPCGLKRYRDGAASRQHTSRRAADSLVVPARSPTAASQRPPRSRRPPPNRAAPPPRQPSSRPPLSEPRRRRCRHLVRPLSSRPPSPIADSAPVSRRPRRTVRRCRVIAGPLSNVAACTAGRGRGSRGRGPRQRCTRGPCPAWPRAAHALCTWAELMPRRGPRALCVWAEREFDPVHPVKFY